MGLFRRKEKQYTLSEAMKILGKEGNEVYMPVAVEPGNPNTKYWIRIEENNIREIPQIETPFQEKRKKMMDEISANGAYRQIPYNAQENYITKPGRVVYNNYQSARNYQKRYGQTR